MIRVQRLCRDMGQSKKLSAAVRYANDRIKAMPNMVYIRATDAATRLPNETPWAALLRSLAFWKDRKGSKLCCCTSCKEVNLKRNLIYLVDYDLLFQPGRWNVETGLPRPQQVWTCRFPNYTLTPHNYMIKK